jgi:excisionase family DNA binding protein
MFYTVAEVASLLGVSASHVRRLCEQGRFGMRKGHDWIITQEELDAYHPRPRGRPKKQKEPPT